MQTGRSNKHLNVRPPLFCGFSHIKITMMDSFLFFNNFALPSQENVLLNENRLQ